MLFQFMKKMTTHSCRREKMLCMPVVMMPIQQCCLGRDSFYNRCRKTFMEQCCWCFNLLKRYHLLVVPHRGVRIECFGVIHHTLFTGNMYGRNCRLDKSVFVIKK